MTTLIVLPAPSASRAAPSVSATPDATTTPATGGSGTGGFAALLEAVLGASGAHGDGSATAADAGAAGSSPERTSEAEGDVAPAAPTRLSPASPVPEPSPDDVAPDRASAGEVAAAPGDVANVVPLHGWAAASGGTPAEHARSPQALAVATTEGDATAAPTTAGARLGALPAEVVAEATGAEGEPVVEAARPGGAPGSGFGHAERSGAGGAPRPGATPEVTQGAQPTAPTPTAPTERPTFAAPAETAHRPLAAQMVEQLDARWPAVRAAGPGTHVLTMRVEPEHFGPVRVVAHIGAEGVRIELLGGTDAAREALRQALPDLRRDLVGVGLSADLDLGARTPGRPDGGSAGDAGAGADRGGDGRPGEATASGDDRRRAAGDAPSGRPADPAGPRRGQARLDLTV